VDLLIVTYKYAPAVDPRAFRWTAIAEHWAAKGHVVDVICAWECGLPKEETRSGVRVHRVGGPILQLIRERLTGSYVGKVFEKNTGLVPGKSSQGQGKRNTVFSSAYHLINKVVEKVFWPDYAWTWYFPARREAFRMLRSRPCDGVISVSVPFTSHLIGICLKKNIPGIPWIVDIGDPFSFFREIGVNNFALYESLNFSCERKVLDKADAITVTTKSTMSQYLKYFPVCSGKIRVIPPMFSIPGNDRKDDRVFNDGDKIRLVFVGTLYRAIRNPRCLLSLFAGLLQSELGDRVEMHLFGSVNDCGDMFDPYESLIGKKIILHGTVERRMVYRAMREASVLVNIGNTTTYQLPSKVVEYASTGKPVLNIVKIRDDSSADFFSSYGLCMNVIDEGKEFEGEELADIVRFIKNPPVVDPEKHRNFISGYMVDEISGKYEEILSSLEPCQMRIKRNFNA